MLKGNFFNVDKKVFDRIIINKYKTNFFKFITHFASVKVLLFLLILLLIIKVNIKVVLFIFIGLFINCCLNGLVKYIFKRKRPTYRPLINERGYSYPSGHTMSAVSFYGIIIFIILCTTLFVPVKIILGIIFIFLIVLIGFSRIYLGVHYFSDVIGAFLLAFSYLLLYIYFYCFILNII